MKTTPPVTMRLDELTAHVRRLSPRTVDDVTSRLRLDAVISPAPGAAIYSAVADLIDAISHDVTA